jgi:hypothetical protein
MAMHNLDLLPNDNATEYWEEGEDCWKGGGPVEDEERNVVDLEAIREISNTGSTFVCMGDDYDLVSSVNELGGELVDVAFDSSWLGKEEVADQRNIVWHGGSARLSVYSKKVKYRRWRML